MKGGSDITPEKLLTINNRYDLSYETLKLLESYDKNEKIIMEGHCPKFFSQLKDKWFDYFRRKSIYSKSMNINGKSSKKIIRYKLLRHFETDIKKLKSHEQTPEIKNDIKKIYYFIDKLCECAKTCLTKAEKDAINSIESNHIESNDIENNHINSRVRFQDETGGKRKRKTKKRKYVKKRKTIRKL